MIPSSGVVDGDGCKVDSHNLLFVSYSKNRGKNLVDEDLLHLC